MMVSDAGRQDLKAQGGRTRRRKEDGLHRDRKAWPQILNDAQDLACDKLDRNHTMARMLRRSFFSLVRSYFVMAAMTGHAGFAGRPHIG
jgi:hypothetical protein